MLAAFSFLVVMKNIGIICGSITALCIPLIAMFKFIFAPHMEKMIDKSLEPISETLDACVKDHNEFAHKTELILHEMQPNGGGSIKDHINKLTVSMAIMQTKLDSHLASDV